MKKTYETPIAEAVKFEYKDQVVAASGSDSCYSTNVGDTTCHKWEPAANQK